MHMASTNSAVPCWWPQIRRKIHLRRRKTPAIRLGWKPRGRLCSVKRMVRRMRLKWVRLHYVRMVKEIRGYYRNLVKEFAGAGAELETIRRRIAVETAAFAVPGLGLSFSSMSGHDRARYYFSLV
ncbi:PREDICTED: uncharacterized protein LOC104822658 [Tarenaya hassleriana]|uniref:uncharacterized protein LOC104822658 n=1 Tax=Tarenaya hassleriana TaxID=28532 RepID=UPI00053C0FCD|nr:PREDICTED: uncharacterized protein LOC104822658 [Tarenaya hassleriana]